MPAQPNKYNQAFTRKAGKKPMLLLAIAGLTIVLLSTLTTTTVINLSSRDANRTQKHVENKSTNPRDLYREEWIARRSAYKEQRSGMIRGGHQVQFALLNADGNITTEAINGLNLDPSQAEQIEQHTHHAVSKMKALFKEASYLDATVSDDHKRVYVIPPVTDGDIILDELKSKLLSVVNRKQVDLIVNILQSSYFGDFGKLETRLTLHGNPEVSLSDPVATYEYWDVRHGRMRVKGTLTGAELAARFGEFSY